MSARSDLRLWLRPGLVALHLFAVVAVVVCIIGGLWQFGIYDRRQADERADRQEVPTVPFDSIWSVGEPFDATLNHRPVTVEGRFGPAADQVWVSGREQDGREGFWLLAPLVLSGDEAMLVVRGFSTTAGDLPPVPDGRQSFDVVLEPGESTGTPLDESTRVLGTVRVPALINVLPYQLFPGYGISTDPSVAAGLPLVDPPTPDVSWTVGLKNLAYSLQWWVFALFAAGMWWRMSHELVAEARDRARITPEKEPVA